MFMGLFLIALQQTCAYFACHKPRVRAEAERAAVEAAKTPEQREAERLEKETQERKRRWEKATRGSFIGGVKVTDIILDYTETDHYIELTKNDAIWDNSDYVSDSALCVILKSLQKNNCLDGKNLNFIIIAERRLVDGYGNEFTSTDKILEIAYSGNDLNKVNWKNIGNFQLLDLAGYLMPLHPLGASALKELAGIKRYQRYSPRFCAKIRELGLTAEN